MKNQTIVLLVISVVIVLISGTLFFLPSSRPSFFKSSINQLNFTEPANQKTYQINDRNWLIINNSSQFSLQLNDKKKAEQILRQYPNLFAAYNNLVITVEDEPQDVNFGWSSGYAFGYSLNPVMDQDLKISLKADLTVIRQEGWTENLIENELSSTLINALERAQINLDPNQATTKSETEESNKSAKIDELTIATVEQLRSENPTSLFDLQIK